MSSGRGSQNYLIFICLSYLTTVYTMDLLNVKSAELNDSRLIATSNYNYAIMSPKLGSFNWKAVSVNGDAVSIITSDGNKVMNTRAGLPAADLAFIENLRDEIANSNNGFSHYSSSSSGPYGGGSVVTSNVNGNGFSRSFSSSSSGSFSSMTNGGDGYSGSAQMNGLSVNLRDESNFSVAKSDLPFNWSQVFYSGNMVTVVSRDGTVDMSPISLMEPAKAEVVRELKSEVKDMQRNQARQLSNTMQQSMDMVSNVFNNIMGQLPRPPSYQSAVGNMFGASFPFGPNNNPFNNFANSFPYGPYNGFAGWPFGSGGGAMAYASARR